MKPRIGYKIRELAEALGYKTANPIYQAIYRGEIPTFRPFPDAEMHIPASWVERQIKRQTGESK